MTLIVLNYSYAVKEKEEEQSQLGEEGSWQRREKYLPPPMLYTFNTHQNILLNIHLSVHYIVLLTVQ